MDVAIRNRQEYKIHGMRTNDGEVFIYREAMDYIEVMVRRRCFKRDASWVLGDKFLSRAGGVPCPITTFEEMAIPVSRNSSTCTIVDCDHGIAWAIPPLVHV